MGLFKRKKSGRGNPEKPGGDQTPRTRRRPHIVPLEIKLLALEALQNGLTRGEVAGIVGVVPVTLSKWQKKYDDEGLRGLYRRTSSHRHHARCRVLPRPR